MNWLLALIALVYPFLAYLGLNVGSPAMVAGGLMLLLFIRLFLLRKSSAGKSPLSQHWSLAMLIIAATLGFSMLTNSDNGILLYPVLVNAILLWIFTSSLYGPMPVVERLARMQQPDLPASGVRYTRTVTKVWSVFFACNGSVAFYTVFFTDLETWTLYNGFISYCLIGTLAGVEWLIRKRVQQQHEH